MSLWTSYQSLITHIKTELGTISGVQAVVDGDLRKKEQSKSHDRVGYVGIVNVPSTPRNSIGSNWSYYDSDVTIVFGISVDVKSDQERNIARAEMWCNFMDWFKTWYNDGDLTTYGAQSPGSQFRFSSTDEPWIELTVTLS